MTNNKSVLKTVSMVRVVPHPFCTSTEGVCFILLPRHPVSRSLDIEFRHQVLSRRKELKDFSHEYVSTERLSSVYIVCMFR